MVDRLISKHAEIYTSICNQVLELDNIIRFAGWANKMGTIIAARYRQGINPLLTQDETKLSFIESVLRMITRYDIEPKLGKPLYSLTAYPKVRRATIVLDNVDYPILMVSFDNNHMGKRSHIESIILNGILPLVSYCMNTLGLVAQSPAEYG